MSRLTQYSTQLLAPSCWVSDGLAGVASPAVGAFGWENPLAPTWESPTAAFTASAQQTYCRQPCLHQQQAEQLQLCSQQCP